MWTTLVNLKENTTVSTKLLANAEFYAFKREQGMTVASFLSAFNVIAGKLESLKVKQDDSSLIGKVIHCLPKQYEGFRQNWLLSDKSDAKFA